MIKIEFFNLFCERFSNDMAKFFENFPKKLFNKEKFCVLKVFFFLNLLQFLSIILCGILRVLVVHHYSKSNVLVQENEV